MPTQLLPAKTQFLDQNGRPFAGGRVYFYAIGTETKKDTFQDPNSAVPNSNPVTLDSLGSAVIWGSGKYRQVLIDKDGNQIWDQVIQDANAGLIGNMVDRVYVAYTDFTPGETSQLTLPANPGSPSNMWVFFDSAFQSDDQYTLDGTTLTFTSPIPLGVQEVIVKLGSTVGIGTPGSGTVTDLSVPPNAGIQSPKLSYRFPNSGASLRRTVEARLSESVSVKDFGAKGDGSTDDTAAFVAASAALVNSALSLVVPAGTFLIGASATIAKTLTFAPGAKLVVASAATLQLGRVVADPEQQIFSLTGTGAITSLRNRNISPLWFGADPTGTTDSLAAAVATLAVTSHLKFPPGKFLFSGQLTATVTGQHGSFVIEGAGSNATTFQFTTASNGVWVNMSDWSHLCQLRNFAIRATQSPAGAAIVLNNTVGTAITESQVSDITIGADDPIGSNYWATGIQINVVNNVIIRNVNYYGRNTSVAGNGISIVGDVTNQIYAFNYYLDKVNIARAANSIIIGSYVQGIYVHHCGLDGTTGIYMPYGLVGIQTDMTITNSQFSGTNGIVCNSSIYDFKAIGNTFFVVNNGQGIALLGGCSGSIMGNHIEGRNPVPNQEGTGIAVDNMTAAFGLAIGMNEIYLMNIGVNLTSATNHVGVTGNVITSTATGISNGSNSNLLTGNVLS